ncbi:hypothetical protein D7Z96_09545 [Pseudarthrobacter phenanthrenivorans]|uniref:Uncharacterized protein n=1 Tax=Pseudarthrobacter phenanthrenivorans TaxID=361575 RepID=A0A3B0FWQ5_PSEPS|nr:hypothetical protein [Pseudarthrobacter phenanthrenivorans]RKO24118.1 hypothetical protein D7Z96_09545 [Pseudarthrobacter phenanthrenivorans]
MSHEQPPIRSRRELRKARDAQQPPVPAGTDQAPPVQARASQPAAAGPAAGSPGTGAAPAHTSAQPDQAASQRSSQIRARDRAALRTIKELEEKEGQLSAGGPPTRRQLRLQQLKEQALTAANPIVPPASVPPGPAAPSSTSSSPDNAARNNAAPGSGNRAGDGQAAAPQRANMGEPAAGDGDQPAGGGSGTAAPKGMTVEQALAARALIAEQAKNQIAKMEHIASLDPEAVDPDILAEQIALAERAAIMNRRAMAKQKLAEQAGAPLPPAGNPAQAGGQRPAPSTANNLAMVTPLEFVQVPGIDRPVMKPPATSHVPVTTRPGSKVPATGTRKRRPVQPRQSAEAASGRSQVIARAEAAARSASRPRPVATQDPAEDLFEDLPRIPARSAHGLEPLDAATAGLARAKRNRLLQFCILAFGIVALLSGILLIISGMSS